PRCDCACMRILPSKGSVGLLRDANDHFSDGAAGFHVGDGLGRSFKRKDLVQDRLNDTLFRQRSQSLQLLPARVHEQVLETHAPFPRQAIDLAIQEPEEPDQWQAQAQAPADFPAGPPPGGPNTPPRFAPPDQPRSLSPPRGSRTPAWTLTPPSEPPRRETVAPTA